MYRGPDSVKVWFFPRVGNVPEVIRDRAPREMPVYPDISWGSPDANFPFYPDLCDYEQHFDAHQIVFDLTFCVSVLSTLLFYPWLTRLFSPRATGLTLSGLLPAVGRRPAQIVRPFLRYRCPGSLILFSQLLTITQVHLLRLTGKSIVCVFIPPISRGKVSLMCDNFVLS